MVYRKRPPWISNLRDTVVFAIGIAGAIHELFFTQLDKPYRLAFCGGLLGLTAYFRSNGK